MIWLFLLIIILILVITDYLIVIAVWNSMIRKEMKNREFGRLANGFMFYMDVKRSEIKGHRLTVSGRFKGKKPDFNSLIHIYCGDDEYVGLSRKAIINGSEMTLRLYILKKFDSRNIKEVSTIRRTYRLISNETTDVTYPFKIKKTFKDSLAAIYLLLMGILFIAFVVGYKEKNALMFLMGIFFVILGFYMLVDAIKSSVTFINDSHYLIDSGFSLKEYHIEDLRTNLEKDNNGKLIFNIYVKGEKKKLAYFYEHSPNFFDAVNVMNFAKEKSHYINNMIPLLKEDVYVLLSEKDNVIYYENKDGYRIVYAYKEEDKLRKDDALNAHVSMLTLEELIHRINEFDGVDEIICYLQDDYVSIGKSVYAKMLKYREYIE